jgi:general secretion pathway protein A
MYRAYWQLTERPFEIHSDPSFYYPSEAHQGTLLKIRYAVESRRGAALLTGATGTGKSLLIRTLKRHLGEDVGPFVHLVFPQLPVAGWLALLADELGAPGCPTDSPAQSVRRIQSALLENCASGRHAVIAVDECHLLAPGESFEALRLLLNFEGEGGPPFTLLLSGQPILLPMIDRHPALEGRLGVKCLLRPLGPEETASYVTHRLKAAGANREVFTADGLEAVHEVSHGHPRQINRVCDLALLIGFAGEARQLEAAHVLAVASELAVAAKD